jgi:hypothetical protein
LFIKLKLVELKMAVDYKHPDYVEMAPKWNRCIMTAKGQDAVHEAGVAVLPALADQSPLEYENYKTRALFYNATWRTIVGLQGMIFRKPPDVTVGAVVQPMLDDVTLSGQSLHMFTLEVLEEALKVGRVGVFVDYPTVDTGTVTAADALRENHRPMLRSYCALSIINWKTRTYKNATVLAMVVLREMVNVPIDEFQDRQQEQFRVLDLIDVVLPRTGELMTMYRVRVIEQQRDEATGKLVDVVISTAYPIMNGKPLDFIPFQFIGVDDTSWEVDEPPLIDLVDTNLSHYRVTADYEHGCHFTGLPTPVISGYTPTQEGEKFYIGSMTAWVFPNAQAKASYLEFTGQGLSCLKENLEHKELMMAVLGARMLEAQPSGVESADTAAIHRGGEQSMLSSVAQAVSIGVQKSLAVFAKFANSADEVKFSLNRDFFPIPMDALTLTAIIAGWQNQAYSYETMFEQLRKGEIVPTDGDATTEQAAIKANPPPVMDVPTTPGNRAGNGPNQGASKGTNSKKGATSSNKTITQLQNSK